MRAAPGTRLRRDAANAANRFSGIYFLKIHSKMGFPKNRQILARSAWDPPPAGRRQCGELIFGNSLPGNPFKNGVPKKSSDFLGYHKAKLGLPAAAFGVDIAAMAVNQGFYNIKA